MFFRVLFSVSIVVWAGLALELPVQASECTNYQDQLRWNSTLKARGQQYEGDFPTFRTHAKLGPLIYSVRDDSVLVVTDVADPDQPRVIHTVPLGLYAYRVYIQPGTLVVMGYENNGGYEVFMLSFNIQDQEMPSLVQATPLPDFPGPAVFQGDRLWVERSYGELALYEVEAPGILTFVHALPMDDSVEDLDIHDGLLYVGMYEEMVILDLSDPFDPVQLNSLTGYGFMMDVPDDLSGSIMLIYNDGFLRTYDVSDPGNLVVLDEIHSSYSVYSVFLQEGAVIVHHNSTTQYYSLTAGGGFGPGTALTYNQSNRLNVFSDPEFLYICSDVQIGILAKESGEPAPLNEEMELPLHEQSRDIKVRGDVALVAMGDIGLLTYDLSDPAHPQWAGSAFIPHSADKIVLQDSSPLILVLGRGGVSVVDVSDPTLPITMSTLPGMEDSYFGISAVIEGDRLYVGRPYQEMLILDVSDPANPSWEMDWNTGWNVEDMDSTDGWLHLLDGDGNYRVFDTGSLPPVEVSSLQVSNWATGLSVQGDRVLIGRGYYGAALLDCSDPFAPQIVSEVSLHDFTHDVLLIGDTALVACDLSVQILDFSDPQDLRFAGNIWAHAETPVILDDGSFLLWSWSESFRTADPGCGLLSPVADTPEFKGLDLSVFPNPFNPRTTVSFHLEKPGNVEVSVYDLAGRLVKVLLAEPFMEAGPKEVEWNGRDDQGRPAASGVYLVKLSGEGEQALGRMVLLK